MKATQDFAGLGEYFTLEVVDFRRWRNDLAPRSDEQNMQKHGDLTCSWVCGFLNQSACWKLSGEAEKEVRTAEGANTFRQRGNRFNPKEEPEGVSPPALSQLLLFLAASELLE